MGSGRDANLPKWALLRTLYRWPPWGASYSSKSKHWHGWSVRNSSSIALKYLIGLTRRYYNVRMFTAVDNTHTLFNKLYSLITVLRRNTNHTKKSLKKPCREAKPIYGLLTRKCFRRRNKRKTSVPTPLTNMGNVINTGHWQNHKHDKRTWLLKAKG